MGETMMSHEILEVPRIEYVADLPFGEGNIGVPFEDEVARDAFTRGLASNIVPLTKPNTADCVDERETIAFADGTVDPETIKNRVVHQIPGGTGLGAMKMCIGADIELVRGAKTPQEAYEKVLAVLIENGWEDAAHEDCGASKRVEETAAKIITPEVAGGVAELVMQNNSLGGHFQAVYNNVHHRLEDGFYGLWVPDWHVDIVASKFPQNYAKLKTADDETRGHWGSGSNVQGIPGYGFRKNGFIEETGKYAFNESAEVLSKIANIFGKTTEEQWRLVVAGLYDFENVGNVLFKKGMPTFKSEAA